MLGYVLARNEARKQSAAVLPLLLLPVLAAARCQTALDCSLGGVCRADGSCQCDPTWRGPSCAELSLLPVDRASEGYRGDAINSSTASWGGQAVHVDGVYHLFFADFDRGCGLGCWGTNSQVARAVAEAPTGPFRKQQVVAPPFRHNPTINKVPGGPFVITSIGNGSLLGDPPAAGLITMLFSDTVHGPWRQRPGPVLAPGPPGAWDSFVTNPSLYFFENGSALMAYRGGPCLDPKPNSCDAHRVAMAFAPRWDAQFQRIGTAPAWPNQTEDPGIFRDARGNFHILGHLFGPNGPGGHSYSADGRQWQFAGQAYGSSIEYTDGSSEQLARRERPQVLMVDGKPAVLYTGVQTQSGGSKHTFTLAQRIQT